jgi:MoaA/NifB/PqqE/SkfB family radical SAM enzyme
MKRPKFISIITTYRCNFRCHMCNIWQHPSAAQDELTPAEIARLPEVDTINLTGGEPFLRQDLAEILTVLRPKTRRLVISTNGYLTNQILDVAEKHPWIGVRISVEGLPAVNDLLRGVNGAFENTITTLTELAHRGLRDIGFGITLSDRNAASLMPLYHLAKMLRVEFATAAVHNSFYFHKADNTIKGPQEISAALLRLVEELLASRRPKDWFRAYFNWGLLHHIRGGERLLPCKMGMHACFLDPFGDVLPCNGTPEKITLGNIREQSFEAIWNSRRADEVRKSLAGCERGCWMMGSVAGAMKDSLPKVAKWVLTAKCRGTGSLIPPSHSVTPEESF